MEDRVTSVRYQLTPWDPECVMAEGWVSCLKGFKVLDIQNEIIEIHIDL